MAAWEERGSLYIQTELCELGSLKDFMNVNRTHGLSEEQIWSFLTDMLLVHPPWARTDRSICLTDNLNYLDFREQGIKHIHEQNMVHLDIKPSNMLLVCLECRSQFKSTDHVNHVHQQARYANRTKLCCPDKTRVRY